MDTLIYLHLMHTKCSQDTMSCRDAGFRISTLKSCMCILQIRLKCCRSNPAQKSASSKDFHNFPIRRNELETKKARPSCRLRLNSGKNIYFHEDFSLHHQVRVNTRQTEKFQTFQTEDKTRQRGVSCFSSK